MSKGKQNASKLEEGKSELKSEVKDLTKKRPVSLNAKDFLQQRYFSMELKDRVLTPKSKKI